MTEAQSAALVPVPTWLKGRTFTALELLAKQHGTSVAVEVALAADERAQQLPNRGRYRIVTPELRDQIAELYAAGIRPATIARQIGCSRASVYNHLPRSS